MDRRTFLAAASALTATPAAVAAATKAAAAAPQSAGPFPLGVMSGDMAATSSTAARTVVWTRYTGSGEPVLEVAAADGTAVFDGPVTPGPDGYTHIDVPGLRPGTSYSYTFSSSDGSARSRTGAFTTPPAPDASPVLTFGATSCTHQAYAPFPVLTDAAGRGMDCFLHLGDHVYCDGAVELHEFRREYGINWAAGGMSAVHAATGLYATWDDHEIVNNWDPEWIASAGEEARLRNGTQAYFEHHPIRREESAPERLWRSFRWGRTAEFFLLDLRSERYPSRGQYISPAQMDWLKAGLQNSPAVFKFVMTPVPVTTMPPSDPYDYDRWEGYTAQRTEILSWIRDAHISGVWWLAGDYHMGSTGHIDAYGYRWYGMREVLMGSAGTAGYHEGVEAMSGSEQWDFLTAENNYVEYRADPSAGTLDVTFRGASGRVLFSRRYTADFTPDGMAVGSRAGAKYGEPGMRDLLGSPLTDEYATYDGAGRWQQFRYGYIYWHPDTGAHEVHGAILDRWATEGWSQSNLGYPVSDEYAVGSDGDRESEFQYGWIRWDRSTATTSLRWK